MNLFIKNASGEFVAASNNEVLSIAAQVIESLYPQGASFTSPSQVKTYLVNKMAKHEQEVFSVIFLDVQNKVIEYKEMFTGTLTQTAVYPREIAKHALAVNALSVILCHNHPQGEAKPSEADKNITDKIKDSLQLLEIKTLEYLS